MKQKSHEKWIKWLMATIKAEPKPIKRMFVGYKNGRMITIIER